MHMGVYAAGGGYAPLASDGLRAGPQDDVHSGLGVGVASLAYGGDAPVFYAYVRLDDAPVIHDEGVGDHRVDGFRRGTLALSHAVSHHLAAAKLDLIAVHGPIFLNLRPQRRVRQAHPVPRRGAVHLRVGAPVYGAHGPSNLPMIWPLKP